MHFEVCTGFLGIHLVVRNEFSHDGGSNSKKNAEFPFSRVEFRACIMVMRRRVSASDSKEEQFKSKMELMELHEDNERWQRRIEPSKK